MLRMLYDPAFVSPYTGPLGISWNHPRFALPTDLFSHMERWVLMPVPP